MQLLTTFVNNMLVLEIVVFAVVQPLWVSSWVSGRTPQKFSLGCRGCPTPLKFWFTWWLLTVVRRL